MHDDTNTTNTTNTTAAPAIYCPGCSAPVWDVASGHKLHKCWNEHGDSGPLAFDTPGAPADALYRLEWWNDSSDDEPDGVEWFATFSDALESALADSIDDLDTLDDMPELGDVSADLRLTYANCDPGTSRARIVPVSGADGFAALAANTNGLDSFDGDSAYYADSVVDDYRTGAYSRFSWHLLAPGAERDSWQVCTIRERYTPCDYTGVEPLDDPIAERHESACCSCHDPETESTEHDLLDLLESYPESLPLD